MNYYPGILVKCIDDSPNFSFSTNIEKINYIIDNKPCPDNCITLVGLKGYWNKSRFEKVYKSVKQVNLP